MVVYWDEVIICNLLIDYLLLLTTAIFAGIPIKRKRYLIAASIGAIYAILSYIACHCIANHIVVKLFVGVLMGYISYGKRLKCTAIFLLLSATLAGIIQNYVRIWQHNLYFSVFCALLFCFTLSALLHNAGNMQKKLIPGKIVLGEKEIPLTVMRDSGHSLCDCRGNPVLIVGRDTAKGILCEKITDTYAQLRNQFPNRRILLFPYQTISGEGLIPAVQCDWLTLGKESWRNIYIGIADIDFQGDYQALWSDEKKEVQHEKHCFSMAENFTVFSASKCILHRRQ